MKAECWKTTNWTFRQLETTLTDKLVAKSNQVSQLVLRHHLGSDGISCQMASSRAVLLVF